MPRPARPRALDAALAVVLAFTTLVLLPRALGAVGTGLGDLVAQVQSAIPLLQGRGAIELPAGGSTSVGAAPVVDSLPQFTREPRLQLSGKIPAFAIQDGRSVQVNLNGAVVGLTALDATGAFTQALTLKDGTNAIAVSLVDQQEVIATASYVVALDRTPPTVTIARPAGGATVDAQNVIVSGSTEAGATITVNGRLVVTTPEGGFTDSFTATPGTLAITVVARDKAGNETTENFNVVAQQISNAAGTTVTVTLDKPTVRPGQGVLATIFVIGPAGPRAGVPVTLSVGVVTIGSAVTDGSGAARIGFAAPANEGEASVVVLGGGASGRASLTISAR
ncbi:MAG TPA: hypothetical protein VIA63_03575 [Candidatus Limnocylindria bacterium]